MKTSIHIFLLWPIFILLLSATSLSAQTDINTLSAHVTRTTHNVLLAEDAITTGSFHFRYPGQISMIFNEKNDRLLMDGKTYVIVNEGKKNIAKGKVQELFGVLQEVLQSVIRHMPLPAQTIPDIQVKKAGSIIEIVPLMDAKTKRRMPFTSFTLTLAPRSGELTSLRMNEKGENYVQYDLSGQIPNNQIDDTVFNLK